MQPEKHTLEQRFQDQITLCGFYDQVASDLAFVLEQDEQRVGHLLYERSQILSRRGAYDAAATTIEALVKLNGPDPWNLYNAACGYGLCVLALDEQSHSRALSEAEAAQRQQFATRAIELLDAIALHGFFLESENADWLLQDPDLSSLREEFDFQHFVRSND